MATEFPCMAMSHSLGQNHKRRYFLQRTVPLDRKLRNNHFPNEYMNFVNQLPVAGYRAYLGLSRLHPYTKVLWTALKTSFDLTPRSDIYWVKWYTL